MPAALPKICGQKGKKMNEKRRCPNCGAFLSSDDSTCYVCGEEVSFESEQPSYESREVYELERDTDYVTSVSFDEAAGVPPEERMPFDDSDFVEPYEDEDAPKQKGGSKAVIIVCAIIVVLALVGAGVFAFMTGMFKKKDDSAGASAEKITVFFDRPSDQINLIDAKKNVYVWSSDVLLSYTLDGDVKKKGCTVNNEYTNLWECEIPAGSQDVYFENTEGTIKTETVSAPQDMTVYYVTDTAIGENGLPLDSCDIHGFSNNFGINYQTETTAPATETAKPTETASSSEETTEETSEPETATEQTDTSYYTVSLPDEWRNGSVDIVTDDNKTVYYDNYNHSMYDMGMLLAVYVYDSDDTSYKEKKYTKAIKSSDGSKIIVIETPSGIEFADSDETAVEEYTNLSKYTKQVINSISVK